MELANCFVYAANQIGGAARLAAPSSYRSTSAFEAIRANLAIPLGMALKTRSKWGCEVSNLLCSAIRNNVTIEGTWIFGGWRLCPSGRLCAHRSVQIQFFRPSKKQHTVEKGLGQNSGRAQLSKVRRFFCLDFSPSRRYAEMAYCTDGRKKPPCRAGPVRKKKQKMKLKKQKIYKFC